MENFTSPVAKGPSLRLRPVRSGHAAYIHGLCMNPIYNRHLSSVTTAIAVDFGAVSGVNTAPSLVAFVAQNGHRKTSGRRVEAICDGPELVPGSGLYSSRAFLTDASVAENITLGIAPAQIDTDRVTRAARIANIGAFIRTELPYGYDTTVGERGVRLSGGQRQRLGIARALYHDADVIVFDESTSALDNLTEAEVMAAVDALPGDKTVVMIAHRLGTVKQCDRIIVMEAGTVVGIDSWDNLIETNAAFQKISQKGAI